MLDRTDHEWRGNLQRRDDRSRHNVTGSNFEIVMSCLDGAPDGMLIFEVFVAALLVDHLDLRHVCQLAQCCKLATRRFHEPISLAAMPSVKCYGPNDA